jgi:thiamine-monophosphate kinase
MAAGQKDRGTRPVRRRASGANSSARSRFLPEFALIAGIRAAVAKLGRARGVIVGIGDDAAVIKPPPRAVVTTDSMIEGVHFRAGWLTPRQLGVRAFRAAVSDVAAMGARPRYVLLSLEIPSDRFGPREALALVRALAKEARDAGAALVGGNVSRAERVGVTVTVIGEALAKPVLRSGARPGHFVFVTGTLGGSAAGCRALMAGKQPPNGAAASAYRLPPVRIDFAAGIAKRGIATSMIDVSDGLLQDLGHLAESSGVAIRVDAATIPIHRAAAGDPGLALSGGEDYELAFTARESSCEAIEKIAAQCRVPVSLIGVVQKGSAQVTDLAGKPFPAKGGFDHLRPKRAKANVRATRRR